MANLIPDASIRSVQALLNTHVGTFTAANMQLQALLLRQADMDSDAAALAYFAAVKADVLASAQAIVTALDT